MRSSYIMQSDFFNEKLIDFNCKACFDQINLLIKVGWELHSVAEC